MQIPVISTLYQEYEESLPHADPRTRDWILLWRNPVYVWALSLAYILFVTQGPKFMAKREPFKLQSFLVVYNLSLVILSLYMTVEMVLSTYSAGYNYICDGYSAETVANPAELRVAKVFWWYFFSKVIEFMDTVLMVLRKKNSQITFLHVYHHVSMLNIWWWVMMFIPGGLTWFGACINALVHVVMYLYYGLSAIPSLREKLWWKKYLTKFQLIQFCMTLSHSTAMLFTSCPFPLWGKVLLIGYMVSMLILFSNFYIQAYLRQARREPKSSVAEVPSTSHTNGIESNMRHRTSNGVTDGTTFGASNSKINGVTNGFKNGHTSPKSE